MVNGVGAVLPDPHPTTAINAMADSVKTQNLFQPLISLSPPGKLNGSSSACQRHNVEWQRTTSPLKERGLEEAMAGQEDELMF